MRFALAALLLSACAAPIGFRPYGWGNSYYEPAAVPVASGDGHGAIAYSRSTGRVGWSFGKSTRWHAARAALAECGVADCELQVWDHNQAAVLVKADDGCVYTGYSPSRWIAINWAMNRCASAGGTDCHVERWVQN